MEDEKLSNTERKIDDQSSSSVILKKCSSHNSDIGNLDNKQDIPNHFKRFIQNKQTLEKTNHASENQLFDNYYQYQKFINCPVNATDEKKRTIDANINGSSQSLKSDKINDNSQQQTDVKSSAHHNFNNTSNISLITGSLSTSNDFLSSLHQDNNVKQIKNITPINKKGSVKTAKKPKLHDIANENSKTNIKMYNYNAKSIDKNDKSIPIHSFKKINCSPINRTKPYIDKSGFKKTAPNKKERLSVDTKKKYTGSVAQKLFINKKQSMERLSPNQARSMNRTAVKSTIKKNNDFNKTEVKPKRHLKSNSYDIIGIAKTPNNRITTSSSLNKSINRSMKKVDNSKTNDALSIELIQSIIEQLNIANNEIKQYKQTQVKDKAEIAALNTQIEKLKKEHKKREDVLIGSINILKEQVTQLHTIDDNNNIYLTLTTRRSNSRNSKGNIDSQGNKQARTVYNNKRIFNGIGEKHNTKNKYVEDQPSSFEYMFPIKKRLSSKLRVLKEETIHDDIIVKTYSNTAEEICFSSGCRKICFEDGYQIIYFPNNDVKQIYPNGKILYYFDDKNCVEINNSHISESKAEVEDD